MSNQIILLSGWWAAAIFFTLWMRALLKQSRTVDMRIAELEAVIHFAKYECRDSAACFLGLFICRNSQIDEYYPNWPSYRSRRILIRTGEAA